MRLSTMLAAFLLLLVSDGSALMIQSHPRGCNLQIYSSLFIQVDEYDDSWASRSNDDDDDATVKKKKKLSRPERKMQERARKQGRKSSKANNVATSSRHKQQQLQNSQKRLILPKNNTTAEDVIKAIKRAQKYHDKHGLQIIQHFLVEEANVSYAYGYRGSLLSRLAVAAMHMSDVALARKAIEVRRTEYRSSMLPMESAAIIRGLLRLRNVTDAIEVLDDELCLPLEGTPLDDPRNRELLKYRALALGSIASRHFFEGEPSMAVRACQRMAEMGPIIRKAGLKADGINMPWPRIIRGAAKCEAGRRDGSVTPCDGVAVELPCNLVYSVLKAMSTFPSDNSDRAYEALSNALVRRVVFVTGAINMAGCPPADRGEAAFIGRSNVGKSSLVNMVMNRKSLAYTSKRPGKTQQFNFFTVNDIPGREKEFRYGDDVVGEKDRDSFYIVDLPGFGFAEVPQKQRDEWSAFMEEYINMRQNLKVLFHLVDSRHGPIDEDARIMKLVSENLRANVEYVVVLTKADKNVKGASAKNSGKVSRDVMTKLRETMNANKVGNAPIILTSAETKLGRDGIWRYLGKAAAA